MKLRHYYPLVGFVLPTLVIGYGFVIPRSCIAGINEQSVGFGTTVLGACLTYLAGIRTALRGRSCDAVRVGPMRRPEFIARQSRRPQGWLGRMLGALMARETSKENDAAVDLLEIQPGDHVLEIGFGHGRSIEVASRLTRGGLVAGVDFSPSMVAMATRRNRALVDRRLVDLRLGDSLSLPFEDGSFDSAWSVHTVYFWDEPVAHMKEVRRVLKDGGRFVLGFRPASEGARRAFPASVYTFRPVEEIRQMLRTAGFRHVNLVDLGAAARGVVFGVASTAIASPSQRPRFEGLVEGKQCL